MDKTARATNEFRREWLRLFEALERTRRSDAASITLSVVLETIPDETWLAALTTACIRERRETESTMPRVLPERRAMNRVH